jgi:hypothetical protein
MFDIGEEQTLSPIPRSPKNLVLQDSFSSIATERSKDRSFVLKVPRMRFIKLISYIHARENNEIDKSLSPDSPNNVKDAYQDVTSPTAPINEAALE